MIFSAEEVRAILAGRKTQTRRPRRDFDSYPRRRAGRTVIVHPFRPAVGDRMPVQRRKAESELTRTEQDRLWTARVEGRPQRWPAITVAHVLVTDAQSQLTGDVAVDGDGEEALDAVRAEGHPNLDEFKQAWVRLHDAAWALRQERETLALVARFDERHLFRPVWAITFELERVQRERFLALRSQELYVTSRERALPDEPPALSVAEHQTHVAANAAMTHLQWRVLEHTNLELELAILPFEERLLRVRRAAEARHVNVSSDLRVLERMVAQRARPEAIQDRLRALEGRVYRAAVAA